MAIERRISQPKTCGLPHAHGHSLGKGQNCVRSREGTGYRRILHEISISRRRGVSSSCRCQYSWRPDTARRANRFSCRHRAADNGDGAGIVLFPRVNRLGIGRGQVEQVGNVLARTAKIMTVAAKRQEEKKNISRKSRTKKYFEPSVWGTARSLFPQTIGREFTGEIFE